MFLHERSYFFHHFAIVDHVAWLLGKDYLHALLFLKELHPDSYVLLLRTQVNLTTLFDMLHFEKIIFVCGGVQLAVNELWRLWGFPKWQLAVLEIFRKLGVFDLDIYFFFFIFRIQSSAVSLLTTYIADLRLSLNALLLSLNLFKFFNQIRFYLFIWPFTLTSDPGAINDLLQGETIILVVV